MDLKDLSNRLFELERELAADGDAGTLTSHAAAERSIPILRDALAAGVFDAPDLADFRAAIPREPEPALHAVLAALDGRRHMTGARPGRAQSPARIIKLMSLSFFALHFARAAETAEARFLRLLRSRVGQELTEAAQSALPDENRFRHCACSLTRAAAMLCETARNPKVGEEGFFVGDFFVLDEYMHCAEQALDGTAILSRWPRTPDFRFSHWPTAPANSAAEVALEFGQTILSACITAQTDVLADDPDASPVKWRDATVNRLNEHVLEPSWAVWQIRRDVERLVAAVEDEFRRAVEPPKGEKDGPYPPNHFRWKEKTADLQPRTWGLLNLLWSKPGRKCEEEDLADALGMEKMTAGAIKAAASRASRDLSRAGIPIAVRSKDGWWLLDLP